MARTKSYTDVEGRQSLSQQLVAKRMTALSVDPKPGQWDEQTREYTQKTTPDGVPQWIIQTLFTPIDGDDGHKPEVVGVTVPAKSKPEIHEGMDIQFVNFGAWVYVQRDRESRRITMVGRSFTADGFRQAGER
ncbi:hypothetical protein [Bifidobacterium breve]|uniref:hypothetical protein n=1 Tax=Bifidobacterium breve TaxID=1685 RepID=UPI0018998DE6|nr:hypothetical protein [Bifidobacterium breve]